MCQGLQISFYTHRYLFTTSKPFLLVPTSSASPRGMPGSTPLKNSHWKPTECPALALACEHRDGTNSLDCPGPWTLGTTGHKQAVSKQEVRATRGCAGVRTTALTRHSSICPSTTVTQGKIQSHPELLSFIPCVQSMIKSATSAFNLYPESNHFSWPPPQQPSHPHLSPN